jgi:hypothetical protein
MLCIGRVRKGDTDSGIPNMHRQAADMESAKTMKTTSDAD